MKRNGWQQAQTYTEVVFWREHRRRKRREKREARHHERLAGLLTSPPDYRYVELKPGSLGVYSGGKVY